MKITTKTIINFLPIEADFKLHLLENYDKFPRDEQLRISDLVWSAFGEIYQMRIAENFEAGLKELSDKTKKPPDNYYKSVVEKTDQEIRAALTGASETVDLSEARKSMEQIVQAINAAKTTPKPQKAS